jgi:hypothetical protein
MPTDPGLIFVTFALSATVTSAFNLPRAYRGVAVAVPSWGTAANLTMQFATTSGGPTFSTLFQEGTGSAFILFSGTGGGFAKMDPPPTPYARLAISSCQTAVMSLLVLEAIR